MCRGCSQVLLTIWKIGGLDWLFGFCPRISDQCVKEGEEPRPRGIGAADCVINFAALDEPPSKGGSGNVGRRILPRPNYRLQIGECRIEVCRHSCLLGRGRRFSNSADVKHGCMR